MIEANIQTAIQYPFETVLGQYFDYEHTEFVLSHSLSDLLEENGEKKSSTNTCGPEKDWLTKLVL